MKPLNSKQLSGTWATVLLPLDEHENIDFARLDDEFDYLLASGVDGIYTNGTAGEFYAQTEDEFDRIHARLAEKCEKAGRLFQIGIGHTSAQISMARMKRALPLAPGAFQVILPDWYPVSDEEAVVFLKSMADIGESIGLVLYNPPHAKRVLDPATLGKLCKEVPSLIGVKVGDGDRAWYASMRLHLPDASIFVPGHHFATGSQLGAAGTYSNVACLQPFGAKRWDRLIQSNISEAVAFQSRICEFLDRYIHPFRKEKGYSNQAMDKLLAAIGAWAPIGTRLRWPYLWVNEYEVKRLQPIARRLLPELFEADG